MVVMGGGTESSAGDPPDDRPAIDVEVVWGDVTAVDADFYSVGHYRGVVPQNAELALDRALSRGAAGAEPLLITAHTKRGMLHADIGDVALFPWRADGDQRVVAVAGMGRPGSFDAGSLRRLVRSVATTAMELPRIRTWCTVLIGSGEGTVDPDIAVDAWVGGISDAISDADVGDVSVGSGWRLDRLVVAEISRERARRIARALAQHASSDGRVRVRCPDVPTQGIGRRLFAADVDRLLIEAIASGADDDVDDDVAVLRRRLLDGLPGMTAALRRQVDQRLDGVAGGETEAAPPPDQPIPTRISVAAGDQVIRVAAINRTSTVPERIVAIDRSLLDDLVERMTDPPHDQVVALGCALYRFLIPPDFRTLGILDGSGPFVFEVDRSTAPFHWEMCGYSPTPGDDEPLGVRAQVARQLRTTYSSAAPRPAMTRSSYRALVIGDPGDPAKGHDLPGARSEAIRVWRFLEQRNVDVDVRIGARSVPREGELAGVAPAERLDVLSLLTTGDYDVVHYAGHGVAGSTSSAPPGWLFATGLLTSNEIQALDRAPALIVANACWSATTTIGIDDGSTDPGQRSRAAVVPSLADEFFRLGVGDYLGTAWKVDDTGAAQFAEELYGELITGDGRPGSTIGDAVQRARAVLFERRDRFGALWAAYQHYGDPSARLPDLPT